MERPQLPMLFHNTALSRWTVVLALCFSAASKAGEPLFEDAGNNANISGSGNVQGNGAGLAWIDYDNDGWDDLFIPNTNGASQLYRNNKDGTFTNVSATANIEIPGKASKGVAVADYDNDGWDDIFVTNVGVNTLLRNKGDMDGDGVHDGFEEVTGVGLDNENKTSYTASFGDVDKDGDLDLWVGQWGSGDSNDFYINELVESGTATFQRTDNGLQNSGLHAFGTVFSDYDDDGDLDGIVVRDFNQGGTPNFYLNDGNGNFSPDPNAPILEIFGMGIGVGDYDADGDLDYYGTSISCSSPNLLATNLGGGNFDLSQTFTAGVTGNEGLDPCGGGGYVFWGSVFLDVDNDGYVDLYAANQNFNSLLESHKNRLYMNNQDGTFSEKSAQSASDILPGVGVAMADYDRDGRMDIAVHGQLGTVKLLRNITPQGGNTWLQLRLVGTESNKRGIGAKVRAVSTSPSGTISQVREIHAGSSHGSVHSFSADFGFPAGSTIDQITIEWPMGRVQTVGSVPVDHRLQITEGVDTPGPVIDRLSPESGPVGATGGIFGDNFCAGNCGLHISSYPEISVRFNQTEVTNGWVFPTIILFEVPEGATTGPVTVTTPGGTDTSATDFVVIGPPTISSFAPPAGPVGIGGSVIGTNLCWNECYSWGNVSETRVVINGVDAQVVYATPTFVLFVVSEGTPIGSGPVTVVAPGGQVTSTDSFSVLPPPPTISSFTPPEGAVGTGGSINGENFCMDECFSWGNVTETRLIINGVDAQVVYATPSLLLFYVGAGTPLGSSPITVVAPGGSIQSSGNFTVLP